MRELALHLDSHAGKFITQIFEHVGHGHRFYLLHLVLASRVVAHHGELHVCGAGPGGQDLIPPGLGGQDSSAPSAAVGHVSVTAHHQTIVQQIRRSVRQQRVALHLSQPNTSSLLPSLDGLAGQLVDGSRRSDLALVADHVSKPLVVDDSDVQVGVHDLSRDAAVERLRAVVVVPRGLEL